MIYIPTLSSIIDPGGSFFSKVCGKREGFFLGPAVPDLWRVRGQVLSLYSVESWHFPDVGNVIILAQGRENF